MVRRLPCSVEIYYPVISEDPSSVFSKRIAALLLLRSHVARFARLELLVKSATSIQAAWRRRVQMGKYKARPSHSSYNFSQFGHILHVLIRFADLMKLFVMFPELSDLQALRLFTRHVQAILRGSHLESFSLKVFILSLCHLLEKSLSVLQHDSTAKHSPLRQGSKLARSDLMRQRPYIENE